jgi:DNA-binding XRE family transcriptional regulator
VIFWKKHRNGRRLFLQETVKAAASYFYANRSVFDAGRLGFQGFAAETQISNEIGGTDMRTTKFNLKEFGLRLRKLRQACGLTQEEFCDVIGISDTHYRKIEAGTRTGSLELIVEMAEYFHVSLDYLLLGETESNSKAKRDILTVIENLTRIAREL